MSSENNNILGDSICKCVSEVSDGEHTYNICKLKSIESPHKCNGLKEDRVNCQLWIDAQEYDDMDEGFDMAIGTAIEHQTTMEAIKRGFI